MAKKIVYMWTLQTWLNLLCAWDRYVKIEYRDINTNKCITYAYQKHGIAQNIDYDECN